MDEDGIVVTVRKDGDKFVTNIEGYIEEDEIADAIETAIIGLFTVALREGVIDEIMQKISAKANIDLMSFKSFLERSENNESSDMMINRMFG